ncbi:hypothetical protein I7I51_03192 [Histoplasma capsulatum]|uniref:Uncharacterized protein n=1 Tax=Ajellomyces capsulatus TaxID=5037 RepID=A0A8A1MP31_AJECA|nr:hypothetical protein I7I51_03192 [Histoplasma capsulatum]
MPKGHVLQFEEEYLDCSQSFKMINILKYQNSFMMPGDSFLETDK